MKQWTRIEFWRFAVLLMPTMLRQPTMVALLRAMVHPVMITHVQWATYRNAVNYRIEHNGQTCSLEGMLNDAWDADLRRIYITDNEMIPLQEFLWVESEDKPIWLGTVMLPKDGYMGTGAVDFVVWLPKDLELSDDAMRQLHAMVDLYKLAGKRYVVNKQL